MNILIGLVFQEKYAAGSIAFTHNVINLLKQHCNVHLLMLPEWGGKVFEEGSLAEEIEWNGFNALLLKPRTHLAYNPESKLYPVENSIEANALSLRIQQYINEKNISVIHIIEWEELKGVFFDAVVKSNVPFVFTPIDYRTACTRIFLREYNERICSGPEDSMYKCYNCLTHTKGIKKILKNNFLFESIKKQDTLRKRLIERHTSIKKYLEKCSKLLPMNEYNSLELQKHLQLNVSVFKPVSVSFDSIEVASENCFHYKEHDVIKFGYIQRVSQESGAFFILEAWKRAKISKDIAQLHFYSQTGSTQTILDSPYKELLEEGKLVVIEGIIADKIPETLKKLHTVIAAYQFKLGSSLVTLNALTFGIPSIVPEWIYDSVKCHDAFINDVNAVMYKNWDVDSLAKAINKIVADPTILQKLSDNCALPEEYKITYLINQYLSVYEHAVNPS